MVAQHRAPTPDTGARRLARAARDLARGWQHAIMTSLLVVAGALLGVALAVATGVLMLQPTIGGLVVVVAVALLVAVLVTAGGSAPPDPPAAVGPAVFGEGDPPPGPEIVAVLDADHDVWRRIGHDGDDLWQLDGAEGCCPWADVTEHGPLIPCPPDFRND